MKNLFSLAAALWAVLASGSYGHEESARIDTLDALTPLRHEENAARANFNLGHPDLGEIGLVNRQEAPKLITLQTNELFSYTSNAFLHSEDEHGSLLWNGRLAATVVPYATRSFTPSISFEQNFFRFDRFSTLDFDTQTASINLKIDLTKDDRWSTNTAASFTRLYTSRFDAGDFYNYAFFSESLSYVHQLGKSPIYTGTTLGGALRVGDPSVFDRWSIFLNSAAIYSPTATVQFAAFVRPEVHFFTNHDGGEDHHGTDSLERQKHPIDFNFSAGASITWSPLKALSVGANFLFTESWSTFAPHSYVVYNPSISLTAGYAF